MEQREIGTSGIKASVIGLGCNNFGLGLDAAGVKACVQAALDVGITLFDMASEHGAGIEEKLVGDALSARRDEVVIATKVGQPEFLGFKPDGTLAMGEDARRQGLSRRWIVESVEESLSRLNTDYIDVYQPHVGDDDTPREETLEALDELVRSGKVRAIGEAATYATAADLATSQDLADAKGLTPSASMQTQYNLLAREAEREIMPELRSRGMSLLPYSPLANGLLTGKYLRDAPPPSGSRLDRIPMFREIYRPEDFDKVERLRVFATERDMTMVELAIAWLLSEPLVCSVIAGATSPEQVEQNAAAEASKLSEADRAELDRITL